MKVHSHPLLADIIGSSVDDPFYQSMWATHPERVSEQFGGLHLNQFKSAEEIKDFLVAFDQLLPKHAIDSLHRDNLLYLSNFFNQHEEKQSVENNDYNHLHQTGQFLLSIYIYGQEHFSKMLSKPDYYLIKDERTRRSFFSRKDPNVYLDPDDHYDGSSVQYNEFNIGSNVLRVPFSMEIDFSDESTTFKVPEVLHYEIQKSLISKIVEEHKDENSVYYQWIIEYGDNLNQLRIKSFQQRLSTSADSGILKIGSVVQDYLHSFYPKITKVKLSEFIWEYFALFKAYKVKADIPVPTDYSELPDFYRSHKITKDSIRLKFKDVPITGYF